MKEGCIPAPTGSPADWMREASLLAAELTLRMPPDAPIRPRAGWPGSEEAWASLARRAQALTLGTEHWVEAAATAAELHPEAAAAFSILSENERLMLPTPASFARIAVAGLGLDYEAALFAALAPGAAIERVELSGLAAPAALCGFRLSRDGLARLLGREGAPGGEVVEAAHSPIFAREASAAATILAEDGSLWIRGRSRRHARQLALDLATIHPEKRAIFITACAGEAPPDPATARGLPVLDLFDLDQAPRLETTGSGLVVIAPERLDQGGIRGIDAPALGSGEARAIWNTTRLPEAERARLAGRFQLTLPELLTAAREAETLAALRRAPSRVPDAPPDGAALERAIRAAGARRMGPFVTTVAADVTLDDLVIAPEMRAQLDDAVAWRRTDAHVWDEMGLPRDGSEAHGLALLFSGPPGGGKTFAARCLANALNLNLYRVDLSQVVSKYIGETEKRLAQIFDEAEAGHGILFFDEADAIFGKRSEVKDAHDRYANIEVGFLLQRMECFGGVIVLATNLRSNLDAAFTRRMQFIIDFPMPGRAERARLWERNMPAPAWRDPALDTAILAERFRLAGGNIRNAAVAAAHLAAAERAPIAARHVARALYRELEKSGLPRGAADFGPLAEHLEELA
jgi:hypothetical protein